MRISNILIKPIITEKSYSLASNGVYVFRVDMETTQNQVALELKRLYNVNPVEVHMTIVHGKRRRIIGTRQKTKQPNWKKAYVTLEKGQKIELFAQEAK